ncbi:MAG: hypothetical protein KY455_01305 [Euryarchaeota archaeon]|nr:hypothetical protein [Euryarchaeota archaeon]
MNTARQLLTILILGVLFAGCLSPDNTPPDDDPEPAVDPLDLLESALADGHDHSEVALHPEVASGFEEVTRLSLDGDGAQRVPILEMDATPGLAFVATQRPHPGFIVLDTSSPRDPEQIGRYSAGTPYVADVKTTPDGRWVFVATQPETLFATVFGKPGAPTPTPGEPAPYAGDVGIHIVDTSDPTAPSFAGLYAGDATGYHMLTLTEISGATYVMGTTLFAGHVDILRFETTPTPHLVPVSTFHPAVHDAALTAESAGRSYIPEAHDMTVAPDPLEGFPLLSVAHGSFGLFFLDLSDPSAPRYLGGWNDGPGGPYGIMFAHTVRVVEVEGTRVAFVASEALSHDRQAPAWVVDVTEFNAPKLLHTWTLPGEHPITEHYLYSTHNIEIVDGRVYMAHYHAGLLVLDISTRERAAAPVLEAFIVPGGVETVPFFAIDYSPMVFDVFPVGDVFYVTDVTGGLRVVARTEAVG